MYARLGRLSALLVALFLVVFGTSRALLPRKVISVSSLK